MEAVPAAPRPCLRRSPRDRRHRRRARPALLPAPRHAAPARATPPLRGRRGRPRRARRHDVRREGHRSACAPQPVALDDGDRGRIRRRGSPDRGVRRPTARRLRGGRRIDRRRPVRGVQADGAALDATKGPRRAPSQSSLVGLPATTTLRRSLLGRRRLAATPLLGRSSRSLATATLGRRLLRGGRLTATPLRRSLLRGGRLAATPLLGRSSRSLATATLGRRLLRGGRLTATPLRRSLLRGGRLAATPLLGRSSRSLATATLGRRLLRGGRLTATPLGRRLLRGRRLTATPLRRCLCRRRLLATPGGLLGGRLLRRAAPGGLPCRRLAGRGLPRPPLRRLPSCCLPGRALACTSLRRRHGHHLSLGFGSESFAIERPVSEHAELAVDLLLEVSGYRELDGLRGRDVHRLAGARVATLTRLAIGARELPEAGKRDLVVARDRGHDRLDEGLQRLVGVCLRETGPVGDLVDELCLVHAVASKVRVLKKVERICRWVSSTTRCAVRRARVARTSSARTPARWISTNTRRSQR